MIEKFDSNLFSLATAPILGQAPRLADEGNTSMGWKTAHRSFYYTSTPEPEDLCLLPDETVVLCIDVQNINMIYCHVLSCQELRETMGITQ